MLLRSLAFWLCLDAKSASIHAQVLSDDRSFEIGSIRFEGNESMSEDALKDVIVSKESPGGFSKFLFRTFGEHLGSKPEYYDPVTFEDDQRRLKEYYQLRGYYDASLQGKVSVDSSQSRVDLQFIIQERRRSYIDSMVYLGFDSLSTERREMMFHDPLIWKGMPYEEDRASAEIARILNFLSNSGYPTAKYDGDHSGAFKSSATKNFFLRFSFIIGRQFTFDGATVHVDPPRADLGDHLVIRQLDFKSGEIYSLEKRRTSERNLNRIGLFEAARVDNPPITDTSSSTAVSMDIFLRPRPRNELSPEILVSDENNDLNLGLGLGYANRNFFGDGRTFNARVRARTQSIRQLLGGYSFRDTVFVGAADIEFQLLQPYFFTRSLSGSWTSTIAAEKQRLYILSILRNRIGISNQFATYTSGFLDWTLERVSPEILDVRAVLREEDQPQFNSILTFTLQRDKTNDIFSPTNGFFNSISLEESGVLPKLVPGIRRGLPFTQYYKATLLGRWYNDLTTSRFNILALKLKTGYQDKYGESRTLPVSIPLNRRFFSGGSGSVRGWRARDLGAMNDELIGFGGNFIVEGSAEMRVNHFRGFGTLGFIKMDNIWGVYFLDFGNNWSDISDFKAREIAMAAGFGFRYETLFGPFRVDFGFRVYDPKGAPGQMTIFQKRLWSETLADGVLHLGIGHAF